MRGESLRAVIEKPDLPGHEFVVSEMAPGGARSAGRSFMVRTRQYKYMVLPDAGGQRFEMLFDLQSDPGETKNLAGQPALAGQLNRHRQLLAQWQKTTEEDRYPVVSAPKAARPKAKKAKP